MSILSLPRQHSKNGPHQLTQDARSQGRWLPTFSSKQGYLERDRNLLLTCAMTLMFRFMSQPISGVQPVTQWLILKGLVSLSEELILKTCHTQKPCMSS